MQVLSHLSKLSCRTSQVQGGEPSYSLPIELREYGFIERIGRDTELLEGCLPQLFCSLSRRIKPNNPKTVTTAPVK